MAGKSPRSKAYEEDRFPPTSNLNTRRHFKSKYISEVRQEDRYKVLSIMVFSLNLVWLLKMV